MDLQLQQKRALVTGSTSGIGKASALALAREGAIVVIHGRNPERADEVANAVRQAGGTAHVALGDLTDADAAAAVAEQALAATGGIDILVNNSGGVAEMKPWSATEDRDWAKTYELNVVSGIRLLHRIVPGMRERQWGRVVQIASGVAMQPWPTGADYAAAKAAMVNMTVALAKELAGTNVTVNTISPGPILTPALERAFRDIGAQKGWPEDWDEIEKRAVAEMVPNPTGRVGRVEDIANAVAYLASPLAGYINGANLRIDGGYVVAVN